MQEKKGAAMIILVLIGFLAVGAISYVFFPRVFNRTNSNSTSHLGGSMVEIPRVETTITGQDGKSHPVSANVTVEIDSKKVSQYDNKEMYERINTAVSNLDYEMLTGDDNVAYVKSQLSKELKGYVDEEDLKAVYLTDISSGDIMFPEYQSPNSSGSKLDAVFDGLRRK